MEKILRKHQFPFSFFFQAEDGIRDYKVTGVQTCALPIFGSYLFVACVFATLLQHPASIVLQFISSGVARRALMGLAMGATAIAIVTSPWGKRSEERRVGKECGSKWTAEC